MFSGHFGARGLSVWNFYIRSLWASSHSPKTYKLDWKDDCKLPPGTIVWGNGVCPAMDQQLVQNLSLYLICWALRSSWSWINSPFFQPQVIQNQSAKSYPYLCKVVLEVFLCVKIQQMSLKIIVTHVTHVGGYCHIKSFIYFEKWSLQISAWVLAPNLKCVLVFGGFNVHRWKMHMLYSGFYTESWSCVPLCSIQGRTCTKWADSLQPRSCR